MRVAFFIWLPAGRIKQTGNNVTDFAAANASAGLKETPKGFSWHHHEDGKTMQLLPSDVHSKTGHSGGAVYVKALGVAALAAVAGETGAEVILGDKPANSTNAALSVQDFAINAVGVVFSVNGAGAGSDKVWGNERSIEKKQDEDK
jgi:hypothetical protein